MTGRPKAGGSNSPARLESYALFRERHPDGEVLVPNNPGMRAYGRNPYTGYDRRGRPYILFRGALPHYINPMERVVAYKVDGKPHAVSMTLLAGKKRVETDSVVMTWKAGQNSTLDSGAMSDGRDVGNIVVRKKTGGGLEDMVCDVTLAFVFHAFLSGVEDQAELTANPARRLSTRTAQGSSFTTC